MNRTQRRKLFLVLGFVFTILTGYVSLFPISPISLRTTWPVVATGKGNAVAPRFRNPWNEFIMTSSDFSTNTIIRVNATFLGQTDLSSQTRVCVLNDQQYKQIMPSSMEDSQSLGCFYDDYDLTTQTTTVNFDMRINETGVYHFVSFCLSNRSSYTEDAITIRSKHEEELPVVQLLQAGLVTVAAVATFIEGWEYIGTTET